MSDALTRAPTIHEIAAMPFPASQSARRKFYNPDWGKPIPDGAEGKQTYRIRVRLSTRSSHTETIEVEAWSEDEARDQASDEACKKYDDEDDVEVDDTEVLP